MNDPTKKLKKLATFQENPALATLDTLEEIHTTLQGMCEDMKTIAKKPDMEMPEMPDVQKVSIQGVEVVTLKGDKGDMGERGEQGERGERGIDGKNGLNGKNGIDGLDGKDGVNGLDGLNGKDGSPDTGADIVNKINDLSIEEEFQISQEHIKGLIDELKELRKLAKKVVFGGGGTSILHSPLHEEFTMNGVDTSVTLTRGVSAQGNGIMALRYQGQVQNMTSHYTVDGNKVNLLFTPEANTIIAITYFP